MVVARVAFMGRVAISTAGWGRGVYVVETQNGAGSGRMTKLVVE